MTLEHKILGQEALGQTTFSDSALVAIDDQTGLLYNTSDGVTWSLPVNVFGDNRRTSGVAYGDNKVIAIAESGNENAYSTDGITWTLVSRNSSPSESDFSLNFVNTNYVNNNFIVSDNDNYFYSTDGISWPSFGIDSTVISSFGYFFGRLPIYSNGTVMVGFGQYDSGISYSAAGYSTDGITWTASTMPSSATWISAIYGDGKFVAVARNSDQAAYSTDGITWNASTLPSDEIWNSVTYGDGKFVATAISSDSAAYSTDGITWNASTLPSDENWYSVTHGDGKFVAVARQSNSAAYSTDGITWTDSTLPSSKSWRSVTYGDGKFVTVAYYSDAAAYSTDGITWTASALPNGDTKGCSQVIYKTDKFVAFRHRDGVVHYSTDGILWNTSNDRILNQNDSRTGAGAVSVAVIHNDTFISYTEHSGIYATSTDGVVWENYGFPGCISEIGYINNGYLGVSGKVKDDSTSLNSLVFSTDLIVWKTINQYFRDIAYGDGKIVTVAYNSDSAAYSTDAITWTASTLSSSDRWRSVTYGDGKFVAVANYSDAAAYSTDGITWIGTNTGNVSGFRKIIFCNSKFFALRSGFSKDLFYLSTDGISWSEVEGQLPLDVAFGERNFVKAAGDVPKISIAYTVPLGKESVTSSIFISNTSNTAENYDLAVVPSGETLSDIHYIRKNIELPANDLHTIETKLTLSAGDQIIAFSLYNTLTVNVFGVEVS